MKDAPFALNKLSPPVRMALGVVGAALIVGWRSSSWNQTRLPSGLKR